MKQCPLCGAILQTGPKRICSRCHLPIKQRDKWRIGADGRLQHKDCGDPEPRKTEESKKIGQLRMTDAN